jgi:hypothetical protein
VGRAPGPREPHAPPPLTLAAPRPARPAPRSNSPAPRARCPSPSQRPTPAWPPRSPR